MRRARIKAVLLIAIPISLLVFITIISRCSSRSQADFSQFNSSEELKNYFESELPIHQMTIAQVHQWLSLHNIAGCISAENDLASDLSGGYKEVDSRIRCTVVAPREDLPNTNWWNSLFVSWNYELDFIFDENILSEIRVWKSSTGF